MNPDNNKEADIDNLKLDEFEEFEELEEIEDELFSPSTPYTGSYIVDSNLEHESSKRLLFDDSCNNKRLEMTEEMLEFFTDTLLALGDGFMAARDTNSILSSEPYKKTLKSKNTIKLEWWYKKEEIAKELDDYIYDFWIHFVATDKSSGQEMGGFWKTDSLMEDYEMVIDETTANLIHSDILDYLNSSIDNFENTEDISSLSKESIEFNMQCMTLRDIIRK